MKSLLAAAGVVWLLAVSAAAQIAPRRSSVRASGDATVPANPDQLSVTIGVTTQAPTAQQASEQNATLTTAVIAALRRLVGTTGEIKTVGYSLYPNYRTSSSGGPATVTGFTANNSVAVNTSDLSLGGKLIDAAIQAGATNVQGLAFGLKDSEPARLEALRQATQEARRRAEAIALGLGARLGYVIAADEGGSVRVVATDARALGASGTAPTPVETGTVSVYASVTLEIELIP
jgi:uncharacterized protein YggE